MRVCLDTNVLVAAFATRELCAGVLRTVRDLIGVRDVAPLPIVDPRSFRERLRSRGR